MVPSTCIDLVLTIFMNPWPGPTRSPTCTTPISFPRQIGDITTKPSIGAYILNASTSLSVAVAVPRVPFERVLQNLDFSGKGGLLQVEVTQSLLIPRVCFVQVQFQQLPLDIRTNLGNSVVQASLVCFGFCDTNGLLQGVPFDALFGLPLLNVGFGGLNRVSSVIHVVLHRLRVDGRDHRALFHPRAWSGRHQEDHFAVRIGTSHGWRGDVRELHG